LLADSDIHARIAQDVLHPVCLKAVLGQDIYATAGFHEPDFNLPLQPGLAAGCGQVKELIVGLHHLSKLTKRGPHRFQHPLIARKSNPTLAGDEFVIDPHGEFSVCPSDRFDLDSEFLLEQRRYTSSAWGVRSSNQAVTNNDLFHGISILPAELG